jgi:hypothetical protein
MRVKLILVLEIAPYEVSCYFLSNIDENWLSVGGQGDIGDLTFELILVFLWSIHFEFI